MKEHRKRPLKWDPADLGAVHQVLWQGKQHLFVHINPEQDQFEVFDTIVHESVHIWQLMREYFGEEGSNAPPPAPATEMEAYSIAFIAKTLFKEYSNAVDEERKT